MIFLSAELGFPNSLAGTKAKRLDMVAYSALSFLLEFLNG